MIKRGIIELSGVSPKFRISRRGVDVDSAGPSDFLIHENYIVAQPYYSVFVQCPFAGYTGSSLQDESVDVEIPDVTPDPIVIAYTVDAGGVNVYPHRRGSGAIGTRASSLYDVYWTVINSTSINIRFFRLGQSTTSPDGAHVIVYRKAD